MASPDGNRARERFLAFIDSKKLRLTSQRMIIIDVVFNTEEHFTADQLLEWSRAKDASISRATVYRTLPLLTESGLVHEMDFGKDQKYYDPNYADHPNHHHIICEDCDRIVEFESEKIEKLEDENINLEDSVKSFEDGVNLVKECQKQLQNAELKIKKLLNDGSSTEIDNS